MTKVWPLLAMGFAAAAMAADDPYRTEAQALRDEFASTLQGALGAALAHRGVAGAVDICKVEAPLIARKLSQKSEADVRRVSRRARNPAAAPEAWQRAVLDDFERRLAAGEPAAALEFFESRTDGGARYMSAITVQPLCLHCHGSELAPDVALRLQGAYPEDRATGYDVGDLRGAFSIVWPGQETP